MAWTRDRISCDCIWEYVREPDNQRYEDATIMTVFQEISAVISYYEWLEQRSHSWDNMPSQTVLRNTVLTIVHDATYTGISPINPNIFFQPDLSYREWMVLMFGVKYLSIEGNSWMTYSIIRFHCQCYVSILVRYPVWTSCSRSSSTQLVHRTSSWEKQRN